MITIRPLVKSEFHKVWPIFHAIVKIQRNYAYDPNLTEEQGADIWCAPDRTPFIAERDGKVVGTYYFRPNQMGPGSHVANAGFMVAPDEGGKGIGYQLGEHALESARKAGYRAMQFNMVVEDNEPSLRLWKSLGFDIVGKIPEAYQRGDGSFIAAYIMYRKL